MSLSADSNYTSSLLNTPAVAQNSSAEDPDEHPKINLWEKDPLDYVTDEIKESYLRCSYKWSFHHIPTFFAAIRNKMLDRSVAWAMLAITVRSVHNTQFMVSNLRESC